MEPFIRDDWICQGEESEKDGRKGESEEEVQERECKRGEESGNLERRKKIRN